MDKKLIGLSTLFIVAFLLFTGYVFFSGTLNTFTRASNTDNTPSDQASLIFAWPLTLPADGETTSEITVFVRNSDGKGLEGHIVNLTSSVGDISPSQIPTDTEGKAIFKLSSTTPGVAEIDARVDNRELLRKISVQFN